MGARQRTKFHKGAEADIRAAVSWYLDRNPKVAGEFLAKVRRAIQMIGIAAALANLDTRD